MKTTTADIRDEAREERRRRDARILRIVVIAFAIVEAVVILGAIVPTLLE